MHQLCRIADVIQPQDVPKLVHDDGADVVNPVGSTSLDVSKVRGVQAHLSGDEDQRLSCDVGVVAAAVTGDVS
ncbi:hypothetical protein QF047_003970 [Arthrobacter sp. W4I7]|nr:hypothetical protein [Arthrobacter sp. W4I7]